MKGDVAATLKEWTLHYLQNKDLLTRQIVSIAQGQEGWDLIVTTKTEPRFVQVVLDLTQLQLERVADKNVLIVTLNKRVNVDALAAAWPELIKHPKLSIMFVNPQSNTENKWIILPHVHERITERKSLKLGLMSLFATVDEYAD